MYIDYIYVHVPQQICFAMQTIFEYFLMLSSNFHVKRKRRDPQATFKGIFPTFVLSFLRCFCYWHKPLNNRYCHI